MCHGPTPWTTNRWGLWAADSWACESRTAGHCIYACCWLVYTAALRIPCWCSCQSEVCVPDCGLPVCLRLPACPLLPPLQEEQLFHNLSAVLQRMRLAASVGEARDLALQLRRMCAAVRASLETHVRCDKRLADCAAVHCCTVA